MDTEEAIKILLDMLPTPVRGDGKSELHLKQTIAIAKAICALRVVGTLIREEERNDGKETVFLLANE